MDNFINKNLSYLRKLMLEHGIDTYIITKFDPHQSEYGNAHWNGVQFISNFTGSNGTVVITQNNAGLWTDARYYLQSEKELKNSCIELFKASEVTTKDFLTFAFDETPLNGVIGFDGRTLSVSSVTSLLNNLNTKNISLKTNIDILNYIWENRPIIKRAPLLEHHVNYCGKTREEKIALIQKELLNKEADMYVVSSLDDIAWLLNIRCVSSTNSFDFNAYAVVTLNETFLFIDTYKDDEDVILGLEKDNIKVQAYNDIFNFLKTASCLDKYASILLNPNKTNYLLYSNISNMAIKNLDYDITATLKAIKNDVELTNLKIANEKDAVCFIRVIKWLKENVKKEEITEYDVTQKIISLRLEMEHFKGLSFETISGYNENGAIIHYACTKDGCKTLKPEGFLLLDSGANYLDGTTDITRTISLGATTEKMKQYYTLVLKSHINLAKLIFLYGSTGINIDVIARNPLWQKCLNYPHGTGHGIGFFLNVHEGPQNIALKNSNVTLEEGMVMSNEPGLYVQDEFGIRLENAIVTKKFNLTDFGQFMCFETISFVPFDMDCINPELLDEDEINWLNKYHRNVYKNLEKYLTEEEKAWLEKNTGAI